MGIRRAIKRVLSLENRKSLPNPFRDGTGNNRVIIHHRSGNRSDRNTIDQVFIQRDYALGKLKRGSELYKLAASLPKPLIVDAGGNIGASACWFCRDFPNAHVVAFEPDEGNFGLMRRNAGALNTDLRQSAIGATDGKVTLIDPGLGPDAFRTSDNPDGELRRESMSRIVAEKVAAGYSPFIAKIDIEGGEIDLFSSNTDWVDLFPLVIVELHDWLLPTQGTALPFLRCIASKNRDFVHAGENVFSIRNPLSLPTIQ